MQAELLYFVPETPIWALKTKNCLGSFFKKKCLKKNNNTNYDSQFVLHNQLICNFYYYIFSISRVKVFMRKTCQTLIIGY